MIKKRENCLYCGEKMESITAKKKFCSALHKLYWHRENKKGAVEDVFIGAPKNFDNIKHEENKNHKLWQQGDPSEKSNAFYLKYGAFTYDEILNNKK